MPKVSVVIPTYNRARILEGILPSYEEQKNVGEIIVVDDCSDKPVEEELAREFKKVVFLRNSKRMGSPYSRNLGTAKAGCEFILQGDDDVELEGNYVETLLRHIDKSSADFGAGRRINMHENETKEQAIERANADKRPIIDPHSFYVNTDRLEERDVFTPFLQAQIIYSKDVARRVRYDEGLLGNAFREETDFQISAWEQGFRSILCPHTLCCHLARSHSTRSGQHARSRLNYEYWVLRNHFRFINKHRKFLNKYFKAKWPAFMWKTDFLLYTAERPFRMLLRKFS